MLKCTHSLFQCFIYIFLNHSLKRYAYVCAITYDASSYYSCIYFFFISIIFVFKWWLIYWVVNVYIIFIFCPILHNNFCDKIEITQYSSIAAKNFDDVAHWHIFKMKKKSDEEFWWHIQIFELHWKTYIAVNILYIHQTFTWTILSLWNDFALSFSYHMLI